MTVPLTPPVEVQLRDGTPVTIRPLVASDAEGLRRGVELLSPHSRYLRFHAAVDHLTRAQAEALADVDQVDHVAFAAVDPARPDLPGIGVARFVRDQDDPTVAEAAITVLDQYQGRGLGTILLAILASAARERGVRTLRNYVLTSNPGMLTMLTELGCRRRSLGEHVEQVDFDLPDDLDELPHTPAADAVRAIAAGRFDATFAASEAPLLRAWLDATLGDRDL